MFSYSTPVNSLRTMRINNSHTNFLILTALLLLQSCTGAAPTDTQTPAQINREIASQVCYVSQAILDQHTGVSGYCELDIIKEQIKITMDILTPPQDEAMDMCERYAETFRLDTPNPEGMGNWEYAFFVADKPSEPIAVCPW